MGNVSRKIEIVRKNQRKNKRLEIKNTVTEMKNDFDGFVSRLNTAEERISALEDTSIESLKTE